MTPPSNIVVHNLATQLRIDSVRSTTEAGSGHPTICLSAAEILAVLFFDELQFGPKDPQHPEADRFVAVERARRADPLRRVAAAFSAKTYYSSASDEPLFQLSTEIGRSSRFGHL